MSQDSSKTRLVKSVIIVMVSMVLSRLTGFFRQMLIPNILGSQSMEADALNAAFTLTNFMYNLLLGGAIAAALIPVLTRYISRDEEERGWRAVSTFINFTMLLTIIVCIFGIIFSRDVIGLIYKTPNEEALELASNISKILFPSVLFLMMAGMVNGILNSYKRFAAAAFGPSLYNICSALSIYFFGKNYGVIMVAVGIMLSALTYFLVQLAFAAKNFKNYRPILELKNKDFIELFLLAIPSILASSVYQINILVSTRFITMYGDGALYALRAADDLWQLPYGIFTMGIITAILPTLSEKLAINKVDEFKDILFGSFKSNMIFILPSAVGLLCLSSQAATAIYRWSNNTTAVTITWISLILTFFLIGLISQSLIMIFNRAFYASNDTRTPLICGIITVFANILFCSLFKYVFGMGLNSVSLAFSLSSVVNLTILMITLNKRMDGLNYKEYLKFIFKLLPSLIAMGVTLFILNRIIVFDVAENFTMAYQMNNLLTLLIKVAIAVCVYFAVALLTGVSEVKDALGMLIGKLKIKKS